MVEHVYGAIRPFSFDDDAWAELGDREKLNGVAAIMREVTDDIAAAMSHGTFYDPDDNHLSRSPMVVVLEERRDRNKGKGQTAPVSS